MMSLGLIETCVQPLAYVFVFWACSIFGNNTFYVNCVDITHAPSYYIFIIKLLKILWNGLTLFIQTKRMEKFLPLCIYLGIGMCCANPGTAKFNRDFI